MRLPETRKKMSAIRGSGLDAGFVRLRAATQTMVGALLTYAAALFVEHVENLPLSFVILAVVLAIFLGRLQQQASAGKWLTALVVLPIAAIMSNEVRLLMTERSLVGDLMFIVVISTAVWARRFGPFLVVVGMLFTLPFVASLITPMAVGIRGTPLGWAPAAALLALFWVAVVQVTARHVGLASTSVASSAAGHATVPRRSRGRAAAGSATTRVAILMGISLTAAFFLGQEVFSTHWTWVVLTAYIVASASRGRGLVLHKGAMRVLGASLGTIVATGLTGIFPAHDAWSIVAVFAILAFALRLREVNYAFWAAGITAALALLYGYFGERGIGLLVTRLEEILIGAIIAIAASWVVLPRRTSEVSPGIHR